MGALRTSEEGDAVVGGEAKQARSDDNRSIDAPGRIIIDSVPITLEPAKPRTASMPAAPQRQSSGLGLVILVYVLASGALAYAIYERFVA